MKAEFDYKAFQANFLEQLKLGKPLLGKDGVVYFSSILVDYFWIIIYTVTDVDPTITSSKC